MMLCNNESSSDIESPLKVGTLNVRGFLSQKKRRAMIVNLKREKLDIIAIQESHIGNEREAKELQLQWKGVVHYCPSVQNRSKGVVTLFKPGIAQEDTETLFTSVNGTILISSLKIQNEILYIINAYSPCGERDKLCFLNELNDAINTYIDVEENTNIICMGDFNVSINSTDIVAGKLHKPTVRNALSNFLQGQNLHDSWRLVHPDEKAFTWSRVCPHTAKRLDYVFLSENLTPYISDSCIKSTCFTDHRLVVTTLIFSSFKVGRGLFKMNTSILSDIEYCTLIIKEIQRTTQEYNEVNPHLLWEMIKVNVREVTQIYCKIKKREKCDKEQELRSRLQNLEDQSIEHDDECIKEIGRVKAELEIIELEAAKGAQIRARMQDIVEGEKCNRYFLTMEKHKANINTIKSLTKDSGERITGELDIVEEIGRRFELRYNKVLPSNEFIANAMRNYTRNLNLPSLDDEERARLEADITMDEISNSVNSMKHGSAPGGDGLPVEFYKVFWRYLKEPLMKCYEHSYENKILSPSERVAIIALFHKGSDLAADNLNNWRPISLTNVDYKILAKVMSLRLNTVIDKLIGLQQVGFMKGRNISLIHRQIDDILNIQRKNNAAGILLAIDFRQAFDTISIECILNSLRIFGFGEKYITWIKILNTDRQSCVKNGGYVSETFSMTNGVRQGCPISPQLFILAVEILAQKIIQDPEIKGLNPHRNQHPKKIEQYADDTSLYLRDINDLKRALAHLREFSIFSNLYLNLDKCYALSTNGAPCDIGDIPIQFKTTIKILGIYFSNLFPAKYIDLNWVKRIEYVKKILRTWSKRNLSCIGKLHVLKTYGMSQFIFIMKSIGLSTKILKEINYIFYSFLWKKKMDGKKPSEKIRRAVVCSDYECGGLRMIDMEKLQDSILLEWAEALINPEVKEWKNLALFHFRHLGGISVFKSKVNSKTFKGLEYVDSMFWKDVLIRWLDFNNINNNTNQEASSLNLSDPIFNNKLLKFKNNVIFLPSSISRNVITIGDMIYNGNIMSFRVFENKYGAHPRCWLDYNVLKNAISNVFDNIQMNNNPSFFIRNIEAGSLGRKYFYKYLTLDFSLDSPLCVGLWLRKLGAVVEPGHWNLVHQLKETRLRSLAWKIIHNIYPTNINLSKMGYANTENCKYCNMLDTLEHFFYHCKEVKPLWINIQNDLQVSLNSLVTLNEKMVILGPYDLNVLSKDKLLKVNHFIAVGKMVISKFKYGPQRHILEIYETECRLREM